MTISNSRTLKVQGNMTLKDLRWLVRESEDSPESTRVDVAVSKGDRYYDSDVYRISVTVEESA